MSEEVALVSMKEYIRRVAQHRKWVLNPDESFISPIVEGLAANKRKDGWPFCPCRDASSDHESDKDIVCPCAYAQADIEELGQCYCGLFLASGKNPGEISSIPERRPQT